MDCVIFDVLIYFKTASILMHIKIALGLLLPKIVNCGLSKINFYEEDFYEFEGICLNKN